MTERRVKGGRTSASQWRGACAAKKGRLGRPSTPVPQTDTGRQVEETKVDE